MLDGREGHTGNRRAKPHQPRLQGLPNIGVVEFRASCFHKKCGFRVEHADIGQHARFGSLSFEFDSDQKVPRLGGGHRRCEENRMARCAEGSKGSILDDDTGHLPMKGDRDTGLNPQRRSVLNHQRLYDDVGAVLEGQKCRRGQGSRELGPQGREGDGLSVFLGAAEKIPHGDPALNF